jgi:hypothetical protein
MAITYTWTIAQLERNTSDGGVTVAHWRVSAVDGDYTASAYGTCGFTPDATAENFVAFEELTQENVLAWVFGSIDKPPIEENLATNIEDQKAPVSVDGLPW